MGATSYILTFIKWEKQLNGRVAVGSGRIFIMVSPSIIKDSAVYFRGLVVGLVLYVNKPGPGKNLGACGGRCSW